MNYKSEYLISKSEERHRERSEAGSSKTGSPNRHRERSEAAKTENQGRLGSAINNVTKG